jgi:hypothetical protein
MSTKQRRWTPEEDATLRKEVACQSASTLASISQCFCQTSNITHHMQFSMAKSKTGIRLLKIYPAEPTRIVGNGSTTKSPEAYERSRFNTKRHASNPSDKVVRSGHVDKRRRSTSQRPCELVWAVLDSDCPEHSNQECRAYVLGHDPALP